MIFNTWVYAFFLLGATLLYWTTPQRWRPHVLIGQGAFFYAYYYPPHLPLILAATLAVFLVARAIRPERAGRSVVFGLGVAGCVGLLAYYKYQGFLADSFALISTSLGISWRWQPPDLRPPLAISFFVFEYVHYLVEVHRGRVSPTSLRDFALFILFFPSLICGPIKRFPLFNPQEYAERDLDPAQLLEGARRIIFGLAKKTLVADAVAPLCAPVFADPSGYTWVQLWLAVYGYALQIYFDFAGYSDIAIGSAKLLGYTVPENFDAPYLKANVAQFWRSWHMSLTSWITDYVYIPLGGNRQGELRAGWNRFAAMTLCGLWHGAAFHFAVWGMYHGIGLNLHRAWRSLRARWQKPEASDPHWLAHAGSVVLTFHFVCVGWVLFVCDLDKAWMIILRLLWIRG